MTEGRKAAANSVLPQLAVTCKIEAECSYQTFVLGDSEVLRNRQLRQHANRCGQVLQHRTNGKAVFFGGKQATLRLSH